MTSAAQHCDQVSVRASACRSDSYGTCHAGPKGEGGLDDATGAGGAGGASMKQSSNTVDLGKLLDTLFTPDLLVRSRELVDVAVSENNMPTWHCPTL